MDDAQRQIRLLAQAIFEMRVLLAGHLGSERASSPEVRTAANLAHALHNQALAILDGESFDVDDALKRIESLDRMLGERLTQNFARAVGDSDV